MSPSTKQPAQACRVHYPDVKLLFITETVEDSDLVLSNYHVSKHPKIMCLQLSGDIGLMRKVGESHGVLHLDKNDLLAKDMPSLLTVSRVLCRYHNAYV